MFRIIMFCIFLLLLEETTYSAIIQRERNRRIPSKKVLYGELSGNDDSNINDFVEEMNDEDLDDILKINGAGLPRDISVDRNEPKIIGFNYGSRKTTPFRYVNTMEEERPKFETMMKSEDKSQDDNNYDSENSEESSNEEILFGSKNDGNNKSKENSELNESDENYSDGVINANKYSALWFTSSIFLWKFLFDISV
ncbi:ARF GTPase-activating protein [Dirofilaria immitis]